MLLFRRVYPPLSTRQKIKNQVSVRKMVVKNEKRGFIKNEIGPERARE